jgi:hypothetical protein
LIVHRSCVDGAGGQWIGGDHVAAALFGDTDESLFPSVVVDVGERGLVVLERAHLLQLLFDPATTFNGDLTNSAMSSLDNSPWG